jgi:hypothetical protein
VAFSRKICAIAAVLIPLWGAAKATAVPVIAYSNPAVAGNQGYGLGLGLDFDVGAGSAIKVTRLGVYDDIVAGLNGIAPGTTLNAQIYRRTSATTGVPVGPMATFTNASPGVLVGSDRFVDVVDFELGSGQYSIVAWGFNTNDQNGNGAPFSALNTGGGLISFVGVSRFGNAVFTFPGTNDGGPANRYRAGTFEFEQVPEPSAMLLWGGLGLAMAIGAWHRSRRQSGSR